MNYPQFSLRDVEYDIVYKSSFGCSLILECIKASVLVQLKRDITFEQPAKKSKRETKDRCVNEAKQWSVGNKYDSIFSAARVAANPPLMLSIPQSPAPPSASERGVSKPVICGISRAFADSAVPARGRSSK